MAYSDLRLVAASEIADELYARLVPTQLPAELAEWLAKYKGAENLHYIGWGDAQIVLRSRIGFDDTLTLQLQDCDGGPMWETVLRPIKPQEEAKSDTCGPYCGGAENDSRITSCPHCAHTLVLATP